MKSDKTVEAFIDGTNNMRINGALPGEVKKMRKKSVAGLMKKKSSNHKILCFKIS